MEALQFARFRLPDVAVLDLQLGSPSGLETARLLREMCSNMRIVFVSLMEDQEYMQAAEKIGADAVVIYANANSNLIEAIGG